MSKILTVLKPFKDATKELSNHDASISMAIPIVTSIMRSLNLSTTDYGVRGMKICLMENMGRRFAGIEDNNNCAVATLLDCKYKKYFYRDSSTFERVREVERADLLLGVW